MIDFSIFKSVATDIIDDIRTNSQWVRVGGIYNIKDNKLFLGDDGKIVISYPSLDMEDRYRLQINVDAMYGKMELIQGDSRGEELIHIFDERENLDVSFSFKGESAYVALEYDVVDCVISKLTIE